MIKSVKKVISILSVLSEHGDQPVPLGKLASLTDLNKATCCHILSTLEEDGYVVKLSPRKGYILGPAVYCLPRAGRYRNQLVNLCRPVMEYLHQACGHSVVLAVLEADTKYIIDYIDDGSFFETETRIRADDIYRTATGRAILANSPRETVYDIYKKYGEPLPEEWPQVRSFEDLCRYIDHVPKNIIFQSCCYEQDGKICNLGYGAALLQNSMCVGAIGIAVKLSADQLHDYQKNTQPSIIRLLEQAAKQIHALLAKI